MRAIRSENTQPELSVRKLLFNLGYRYRLHRRDLPGKPDIVFPGRRKVIFVHGCFWHGHKCKRGNRLPNTNTNYWSEKISRNISRFKTQLTELKELGWEVQVVWECELKDESELVLKLKRFLDDS